jgi:4-hydroxy-2-oxoheptanedioate aldolase
MRVNKTKAKLRAGKTVIGVGMPFDCPEMVELLGAMRFDYVTFDLEHEPFNELSLVQSLRAADAYGITSIVRVPNEPNLILRLLDAGAQGVHVPNINTAEDAQRVVDATHFHPLGKRTFYSTGRSGQYGVGMSEEEFVEVSNREMLVILQVEAVEGIQKLDDILAVSNIDAIQFGPKDLRQSMGFPDYNVVWEEVEDAVEKVNKAGVWTSMVGWVGADPNSDKMARYGDLGIRMITGQAREFLLQGGDSFRRRAFDILRQQSEGDHIADS